jgi:hypothetical protein
VHVPKQNLLSKKQREFANEYGIEIATGTFADMGQMDVLTEELTALRMSRNSLTSGTGALEADLARTKDALMCVRLWLLFVCVFARLIAVCRAEQVRASAAEQRHRYEVDGLVRERAATSAANDRLASQAAAAERKACG